MEFAGNGRGMNEPELRRRRKAKEGKRFPRWSDRVWPQHGVALRTRVRCHRAAVTLANAEVSQCPLLGQADTTRCQPTTRTDIDRPFCCDAQLGVPQRYAIVRSLS